MPALLILTRRAADYHALVAAARLPDLSIVTATDVETLPADAGACDLVLGEPSLISRALARLTSLRWAQSTWAGVEPLLDPSLRRDYVLTNARGVFGPLMSEYVFGYILAHERLMFTKWAAQQERRWDPTPPGRLRGRVIGLLGVGSIGAHLAGTAKHFGMRVRGYTRSSASCAEIDEYFHGASTLREAQGGPEQGRGAAGSGSSRAASRDGSDLRRFAADLDYLVSVMPNTAATRHLVDAELLAALPPRAVFLNPGRGSVVDEAALVQALTEGRLAGAVLDVFQTEPLPADHPLWRTPNTIITSHTAALSFPEDIAPIFIENYGRWVSGQELRFRVSFEDGY